MRCSTCKTCLSAVKNGHTECALTFKSKKVLSYASHCHQKEMYTTLKANGCPRCFDDELINCAQNYWNDEVSSLLEEHDFLPTVKNRAINAALMATNWFVVEKLAGRDYHAWLDAMPVEERRTTVKISVRYSIASGNVDIFDKFMTLLGHRLVDNVYADDDDMCELITEVINSKDGGMITYVFGIFDHRSDYFDTAFFDDAIQTNQISVLRAVMLGFQSSQSGLRGITNEMKLATIRESRLDMLKYLDEYIPDYPPEMMRQMHLVRGKTTQARKEMIAYVRAQQHDARVRNETVRQQRIRIAREREAMIERAQRDDEARRAMEQTAPAVEKITNLHKALAIIEDCDLPEGKYLELCNLLMDVHRHGVRA